MRNTLFLLMLIFVMISCKNKELCDGDLCKGGNIAVKVVVNWDDQSDARIMRMNIFSQTNGVADYGRDNVPYSGEKMIKLFNGASYIPLCYDYYTNVQFSNETDLESFQAYCAETSRQTYRMRATPVEGERTVEDPGGDFFVHSWQETFDVAYCSDCADFPVLNFYPKNILRQFTYRINNIVGAQNIASARGAISGMAATYFFNTDKLTSERSTVLFENSVAKIDEDGKGYIEGVFYTFGPVYPYRNRFTIEILAKGSEYFTAYWDMSGQISESMANRDAKLARDGYDILITNNANIPEIPDPEETPDGSGFEIEVGEWDNVDIYL
ncbi:DUF5119 domain-containing protein [Paludibacteraceae bacterium OttesenSCG-928-F17]|nr:DUF5119 domain-containing protein [Paludibacteraceae bacterium OttesenSCG-928-F17]